MQALRGVSSRDHFFDEALSSVDAADVPRNKAVNWAQLALGCFGFGFLEAVAVRVTDDHQLAWPSGIGGRVQLTTDGLKAYLWATALAFDDTPGAPELDYAVLHKLYGYPAGNEASTRFSPAECVGIEKRTVRGDPDPDDVSTSYIERSNLTMRMSLRRFTRLTNAFSKKVENHEHAISIHLMHYNYCRKHMSLKGETPAMAAGLADRVWSLSELVALIADAKPAAWGSKRREKRAALVARAEAEATAGKSALN